MSAHGNTKTYIHERVDRRNVGLEGTIIHTQEVMNWVLMSSFFYPPFADEILVEARDEKPRGSLPYTRPTLFSSKYETRVLTSDYVLAASGAGFK